jgi:hypothetical protein
MEWGIAEHFGWTLDYIDGLPEGRIIEWFAILDGRAHANGSIINNG